VNSFDELDLIEPLRKAIADQNYVTPTPIQAKAIPPLLAGQDVLGCAQTGTGKTAAFLLPILQSLMKTQYAGRRKVRALILSPTRELALQIGECCEAYAEYLPLRHVTIFGGVSQNPQVNALRRGVDVLVATPGRLLDLHGQGLLHLDTVEYFVLDEADRMLDMGFIRDIRRILAELPDEKQNLLFSATMPDSIVKLASDFLSAPVRVEVHPQSSAVERITQQVMFVERPNKKHLLARLLEDPSLYSAVVFTRTKHGADRVARILNKKGVSASAIHGNKSQGARQRALAGFKSGDVRVLVATDIASRGIDVDGVSHVINHDLPNIPESYVHRIGRTGRAGHDGIAISFCDETESEYLSDIEKLIGKTIERVVDHEWHHADAIPPELTQREGGRRRGRGRRRKSSSQTTENTPQGTQGAAPSSSQNDEQSSNKRRRRRRRSGTGHRTGDASMKNTPNRNEGSPSTQTSQPNAATRREPGNSSGEQSHQRRRRRRRSRPTSAKH